MGNCVLLSVVVLLSLSTPNQNLPSTTIKLCKKGNCVSHKLIWTTDDHPNQWTPTFLQLFKTYNIKATWFVNTYLISNSYRYPKDKRLQRYVSYYKTIKKAGHVIGNHGHTHTDFCYGGLTRRRVRLELGLPQRLLKKTIGLTPLYWRPPNGSLCKTARQEAKRQKLKLILWHVSDYRVSVRKMKRLVYVRAFTLKKKSTVLLFHHNVGKLKTFLRWAHGKQQITKTTVGK